MYVLGCSNLAVVGCLGKSYTQLLAALCSIPHAVPADDTLG